MDRRSVAVIGRAYGVDVSAFETEEEWALLIAFIEETEATDPKAKELRERHERCLAAYDLLRTLQPL